MRRVIVDSRDPRETKVREVMTRDVVTVDECAALEEAMELMQANNCRHLPVTRDNRVVGFLSMRDLMNYELASKTEELDQIRAYIAGSS
jgi:signal-transduction protein with cAMP-binding, CBS, and nucleotidyltransferase domain